MGRDSGEEEYFNSMIQQRYQFPQMADWLLLTYIGGGVKKQSKPPQRRTGSTSKRSGIIEHKASDPSGRKKLRLSSVKCEENVGEMLQNQIDLVILFQREKTFKCHHKNKPLYLALAFI